MTICYYKQIQKYLNQSEHFINFDQCMANNEVNGLFTQLNFSLKSLLLARAFFTTGKNILLISQDDRLSEDYADDLILMAGKENVSFFPDYEVLPFEERSPHYVIRSERVKVLSQMVSGKPHIYCLSLRNLLQVVAPGAVFANAIVTVKALNEIILTDLIEKLVNSGYEHEFQVVKPGQFSKRGGIVDIFSPNYENPLRIEFFGDDVYSIRHFSIENQRSISGELEQVDIIPAREVILSDINPKSKLKEKTSTKGFYEGIEQDISLLYTDKENILSYFDKLNTIIFWDHLEILENLSDEIFTETQDLWVKARKERKNRILPEPDGLFLSPNEVKQSSENFAHHILTTAFTYHQSILISLKQVTNIEFSTEPAPVIDNNLAVLEEYLVSRLQDQYTIFIQSENNAQKLRMQQLLPDLVHRLNYSIGVFHKGFLLKDIKLLFLTDHEIFQRLKRKKTDASFSKGEALTDYDSVKPGDYIVHIDHGIGIYEGLKTLDIEGKKIECLSIQYAQGDRVYVPTWQLGLVAKYVSEEGSAPVIHKLGTKQWELAKQKAKKQIELVVDDIVQLYAERTIRPGIQFNEDNEWQTEMEDSFIFEDTPDQRRATDEIKKDMESDHPMERLLCGDVGFGKTEVAIRAAFKAVMSGFQVAVLVPTTLLAEQHYSVFKERLAQFPVRISMFSRFRSPAMIEKDIVKVAQGEIDIVIGTHRILSQDVKFKRVGLLIIDEEHRFGVKHKERIRQIKASIDTLYMSATPIPRTMNMVLCKLKSISLIQTSPKARLPIRTVIVPYDKEIVKEAIQREIDRGGQIFFLHNRVETIEILADDLKDLMPNVRFRVGHGQLPEKQLESVIVDFSHHKFDVLIASTIIESGIDIPNANTIIINRADMFGLAQLYQIRGRVGRSNRRAYAYLMIPKNVSPEARKRLETLTEYESLGSGYQIAMRDLEIRGAGTLLGTKQSGVINSIGFNFYNRLLDQAIHNIQKNNPAGLWDEEERVDNKSIEIESDFYFPQNYITNEKEKISIYKRMLEFDNENAFTELKEELVDRFGEIPEIAHRVFDYYKLRMFAVKLGLSAFQFKGNTLIIEFIKESIPSKKVITEFVKAIKHPIKFDTSTALKIFVDLKNANFSKDDKIKYGETIINALKTD